MQIRIGQYDGDERDGEGIVFVVGATEAGGIRGREKEKGSGEGSGQRDGSEREREREWGWIRLRSATAADPGNTDGVGPKALSVADKPPRSDNTLYIAGNGNLNPRLTTSLVLMRA